MQLMAVLGRRTARSERPAWDAGQRSLFDFDDDVGEKLPRRLRSGD